MQGGENKISFFLQKFVSKSGIFLFTFTIYTAKIKAIESKEADCMKHSTSDSDHALLYESLLQLKDVDECRHGGSLYRHRVKSHEPTD